MRQVNARPTQPKRRVRLLQRTNERFQRGKGLIGPGIESTRDDGFAEFRLLCKRPEKFHIAGELLLLIGKDLPSTKKKLRAQQANTFRPQFDCGTRSLYITNIGKNLHLLAISR